MYSKNVKSGGEGYRRGRGKEGGEGGDTKRGKGSALEECSFVARFDASIGAERASESPPRAV